MRKLICMMIVMLLLPFAIAQGESLEERAGTMPSGALYAFDIALERIQLGLIRNPERRIEVLLAHLDERQAEAELELEAGNDLDAETAVKGSEESLDELKTAAESLDDLEKRALGLEVAKQATSKHVEVLKRVREKLQDKENDNAALAVGMAIGNAESRIESIKVRATETDKGLKDEGKRVSEVKEMIAEKIEKRGNVYG